METKNFFTLSSILNRVKSILDEKIKNKFFWLKVEIANVNNHRTGHIYLELAETKNGVTIAECSATLWNFNNQKIRQSIGDDINSILKKGNEILALVEISFDIKYGLKINITEIDINFNLGQIEKRRKETIDRLTKEGLIDLNKRFTPPIVIKNIALIASENTSGYSDFIKQIEANNYGYKFSITLFPCAVQGEKAELEIINRLKQINALKFDAVVIIRGGGSKMDLDIFNSYNIALEITHHNNPVFTGIGHETDFSVVDLVANRHFKTPTAVANHLIELAYNFDTKIQSLFNFIKEQKDRILENRKNNLKLNIQTLASISISSTQLKRGSLHTQLNRIFSLANEKIALQNKEVVLKISEINNSSINKINSSLNSTTSSLEFICLHAMNLIKNKNIYIENMESIIPMYSPQNLLKRGYAIPLYKGVLYKGERLKVDELLELKLEAKTIVVKYQNEK